MTADHLFWSGVAGVLVLLALGVTRFRRHPRVAAISVALLALLLVALVGEAAARLYYWHTFGVPLRATMLASSDPELGWRGIAVTGDRSSPRPRVLFVGDSFTTV